MPQVTRPLASFYTRHLAIGEGCVRDWTDRSAARFVALDAVHVTVAREHAYAIDREGRLFGWTATGAPLSLLQDVAYASAGESGLLVVSRRGDLLERRTGSDAWTHVAAGVRQAWVGDSSNYHVTADGDLHAAGLAHRGQYGDGLLAAVEGWKRVARDVVWACAHTGHALLLKRDGRVEGTGGNRFGPLGTHGYGDKADVWGTLFEGAAQIATGARHSAAVRADGALWIWGENEGLAPKPVLADVAAVACGDTDTLALTRDGRLWQWSTGETPRVVPGA